MATVAEAFYRAMASHEDTEDYWAGLEYARECGAEPGTQSWFECFYVGVSVGRLQQERTGGASRPVIAEDEMRALFRGGQS
jgi:hypothetical protein